MDKTTYKTYSSRLFTWCGGHEGSTRKLVSGTTQRSTLQTPTWPVAFDVVSERTGVILRFEKAGLYDQKPGYPLAGQVGNYTCRTSNITITIIE